MKTIKRMKTMKTGSRIAIASKILTVLAFGLFLFTGTANAQDKTKDTTSLPDHHAPVVHPAPGSSDPSHDLASAAANPISNMIQLPFENNFNFGSGANGDQMQWTTNLMPVIPFNLTKKMLFVNRIIIPVQNVFNEDGTTYGVGNTNWSMWVVPAGIKINKGLTFEYGLGPALMLPTATSPALGDDSFGIGATSLILFSTKHIVAGFLTGFVDSYKTDNLRVFWAQYFFTYNIKKGWYVNSSPNFGANFKAEEGQKWDVPLGGGFGKIATIGKQPINLNAQAFYNLVAPDGAGTWTFQFQFILMFPKQAK